MPNDPTGGFDPSSVFPVFITIFVVFVIGIIGTAIYRAARIAGVRGGPFVPKWPGCAATNPRSTLVPSQCLLKRSEAAMPNDPTGGFDPSSVFPVFITIFVVFVIGIIGTAIYRAARIAKQGGNPLTLDNDLEMRALRSAALAPDRSKADRLAELDALRSAGTITEAEHAAARTRIIAE